MTKSVNLIAPSRPTIWQDEAESTEWYRRMNAMEAAFAKDGIPAIAITKEMAIRWRGTSSTASSEARKAAAVKRHATMTRNDSGGKQSPERAIPAQPQPVETTNV